MGKVWGETQLTPVLRLAQRFCCPQVPGQTLPAAGSSCQRFLLWTPQPSPSRWGGPFRCPSGPGSRVCEWRGGRGGSTLTQESARSELGRRSPNWAGGDRLGRCGRHGAAQLLTTHCPPPTQPALPPHPRPPQLPAFQRSPLRASRVSPRLSFMPLSPLLRFCLPTPGAALLLFFSSS